MTSSAVNTAVTDYPASTYHLIRGQHWCCTVTIPVTPESTWIFPPLSIWLLAARIIRAETARNRMAKVKLCTYHWLPSVVYGRRHGGVVLDNRSHSLGRNRYKPLKV